MLAMVRKPSHGNDTDAGKVTEEANDKERKGLWSPEEDERLFAQITYHGVSTWSSVAQLAGLRRSGKSCRLRWMNYLRPDLKKEPISKREEEIIISLQKSLGNRWSTIAARMPGRTDNEIKNYWNSRFRKRRLNTAAAAKAGRAADGASTEPAPADEEKKVEVVEPTNASTAAAAAPLPIPARLPVFACQLHDGVGGGGVSSAGSGSVSGESTPSTTTTTSTQQQNSGDESEASAGDSDDMIHFLSFDDLDYPADHFLMDVPAAMDAWESELYPANSMSSLI